MELEKEIELLKKISEKKRTVLTEKNTIEKNIKQIEKFYIDYNYLFLESGLDYTERNKLLNDHVEVVVKNIKLIQKIRHNPELYKNTIRKAISIING